MIENFLLLVMPDFEAMPMTQKTMVMVILINNMFKIRNALERRTGFIKLLTYVGELRTKEGLIKSSRKTAIVSPMLVAGGQIEAAMATPTIFTDIPFAIITPAARPEKTASTIVAILSCSLLDI